MDIPQGSDLTKDAIALYRVTHSFRVAAATSYPLGAAIKLAPQDSAAWIGGDTVVPTAAAASEKKLIGIVSADWAGFDGGSPFNGVSAAANARSTQIVKATVYGYHPAALIDQAGNVQDISDGTPLASSSTSAGRLQGVTTPVGGANMGFASLPAAGIGSSLTKGALTQASQTLTVGGAPGTGDVLTATIQIPYAGNPSNLINPGTAVTYAVSVTLTAAQAVSTTTAATALAAALNADPVFSKYYTATPAVAVVTVAVNALSVPFLVSYSSGNAFYISLSGSVGNSITLTAAATQVGGTSTLTSAGATLAGGAGFFGAAPVFVKAL